LPRVDGREQVAVPVASHDQPSRAILDGGEDHHDGDGVDILPHVRRMARRHSTQEFRHPRGWPVASPVAADRYGIR
jgi:hypothetical protein